MTKRNVIIVTTPAITIVAAPAFSGASALTPMTTFLVAAAASLTSSLAVGVVAATRFYPLWQGVVLSVDCIVVPRVLSHLCHGIRYFGLALSHARLNVFLVVLVVQQCEESCCKCGGLGYCQHGCHLFDQQLALWLGQVDIFGLRCCL